MPTRLLVQVLQAVDLHLVEVIERLAGRERRGQGRVVGDAAVHRLAADGVGLADRLLALGGVDDQVDLVVLDHVDDVRAALAHLVDAPAGDAGRRRARAPCRSVATSSKPRAISVCASGTAAGLVAIAHADQAHAVARQHHARGALRLRIGLAEGAAGAHDLAGRLHLRAEDRIGLRELAEREHRFLDRVVRRHALHRARPARASLRPVITRAAILASGTPGRLGHERHGARGARIDLEHVDDAVLDRELDVHQADDVAARARACGSARAAPSCISRDRLLGGSEQPESPECTPACSMCSMMPPISTSSPSQTASTSTSIATSRKRSSSTGLSFETLHRVGHVGAQVVLVEHDFHGAAAEHVARAAPPAG